ncbi:MAG: hypothetical protein ACFB0B_16560 [Thermonemataceae bacterium]|mgnify:CR=1 FL=1
MKNILLYTLFFLSLVHFATAQRLSDSYWHDGKLVTQEGDTMRGKLKYDLELEVVQMDLKVAIKTFSTRNIVSFIFMDARTKNMREFVVLPFTKNANSDYRSPTMFELLTEGSKLTLLSRERLVVQTAVNNNPYVMMPTTTYLQAQYDFFFLTRKGQIIQFRGNRNDLLEKLGDSNDRLKKFIKQNKLRTDRKYDMAKIIDFYNTL